MSPEDEIKLEGFNLEIGRSIKMLCPFCEGGASKEVSLSVTRDSKNLVLYCCHRAKCSKSNALLGMGEEKGLRTTTKKFMPYIYPKMCQELEIHDLEFLSDKWHLDIADILEVGWALAVQETGGLPLLMPVFSPLGALRGHVLRIQREDGTKEVKTFKILDEPWLCWYNPTLGDIVVVEDQISALRCAEYTTGIALCGTNLSSEKFEEILRHAGQRKVYIALDKDALKIGIEFLRRYRIFMPNLNILPIQKDIKNMTQHELLKLGGPFS